MKIIGITGGAGSGKSEVLAYLKAHFDADVVQADQVAHEIMEPGQECYDRIVAAFGREILDTEGRIDRRKMADLVFASEPLRKRLNGIVHPEVKKEIRRLLQEKEKEPGLRYFFIEAALLIEDHYEEICEELWYIHVPEAVRMERLCASRGYSEEKCRSIFASQLPEAVFYEHCAVVIENGGSREETFRQIDERLNSYR